MKQFKVGDKVFVSNPDMKYEKNECSRKHKNFFGTVVDVVHCEDGDVVEVVFDDYITKTSWAYLSYELSLASELKNMTLEEFENTYDVKINAKYTESRYSNEF
jgi:hypothetical protein